MHGRGTLITRDGVVEKSSLTLHVDGGATLRPLEETDVTSAYVDGLNDPRVSRFLVVARREEQTLDSVRAYVSQNWSNPAAVLFGIYIDQSLRGTVRLHEIDYAASSAVIGVALFDAKYWGQGWGSRCIRRVAEFAVQNLQIDRVVAASYRGNAAAIRSFAKAGFVRTPDRDTIDDFDTGITCEFRATQLEAL